jgi:glycosyltransferase involved in cell wall biosynthesis
MKISLDASPLNGSNWSGVAQYTYQILNEMTLIGAEHRFTVHFDHHETRPQLTEVIARPNVRRISRSGRRIYTVSLPVDIALRRCTVHYSFNSRLKFRLPCPAAFTIYDCGWFLHPEFSPPGYAAENVGIMRNAVSKADLVFTISEAVKAEIVDIFGIGSDRVVVAPCAALPPEGQHERRPTGLPETPFILMVNPGRGNKNWENALQGFYMYRSANPASPLIMVMAGDLRYTAESIRTRIAELGLTEHVILTGYIDAEELEYLYRHALLLLYPSWYEGFGIPVLEAMSRDLPAIISDIPVFRETAGDAALYVPPGEPEGFARAISCLADNDALRRQLISRGRHRLEHYTWRKSAQITLDALMAITRRY